MAKRSIQGYVELASGLGELTRSRAKEAARELLSMSGADASSKKIAKQASQLAEELLTAAETNRKHLVNLVRREVESAMSRVVGDVHSLGATVTALASQVDELARAASGRAPLGPSPERSDAVTSPVRLVPDTPSAADGRASTPVKRTATPRRTATRSSATKSPAKRSPAPQKSTASKSTAKKSTAKKSTAKKSAAKKSTTTKSPARKSTATTTAAAKTTGGSSTAKKATPRKATARKTTPGKTTSARKAPAAKVPATTGSSSGSTSASTTSTSTSSAPTTGDGGAGGS